MTFNFVGVSLEFYTHLREREISEDIFQASSDRIAFLSTHFTLSVCYAYFIK